MSILITHYRPVARLQQLIELKQAHFPVGKAIRAGLSISLTFALGLLSGYVLESVFLCIPALSFSAGEASNMSYRAMFRHTFIASLIGGLGVFAGSLVGLPWFFVIIIMVLLAFFCSIISNYGMPYSVGTMIALVMASVIVGMPIDGMGWKLYVCFQLGTAFYLLLLGCQALLDSHAPERLLLSKHIKMLADYARIKSQETLPTQVDESKVQATLDGALDSYFTLYSALLNSKYQNFPERNQETDRQAALLQALDSTLSHLVAINKDTKLLGDAATLLDEMADAIARKSKTPPSLPDFSAQARGLFYSLTQLLESLWPSFPSHFLPRQKELTVKASLKQRAQMALKRLIVGKEVITQAYAFAACMGVALASKYVIHENHWFWVPLTIALTMKPDFGSVFARTVMRCLGTILGACIGTVVLFLLPKGVALIVAMGVLAALIPWAKMVSYATQVIVITAILLLLLDLLSTGPMTVNYAGQRIMDTIIAGVIILVFNYMLWPQRKNDALGKRFDGVLNAIRHYLKSACQSANGNEAEFQKITQEVFKAKIAAYQAVSDLRTELHRLMLEPAPVGVEATSWFPLVAGAERLCDKITVYFIHRMADSVPPAASDINYLLSQIEHIQKHKVDGEQYSFSEKNTGQINAFLFGLREEIINLSKLLETNISNQSIAGHIASVQMVNKTI